MLNEEQRQRAIAALREYLQAPDVQEEDSKLDRNRAALIDGELDYRGLDYRGQDYRGQA